MVFNARWSEQYSRSFDFRGSYVRQPIHLPHPKISPKTPRICWPFIADQPTNAARLSCLLDVAYELFEVRTGESGLKPIHRLGRAPVGTIEAVREEAHTVLDKAFGADGARKRANAQALAREAAKAWDEEGPARRDLRRFVATLTK